MFSVLSGILYLGNIEFQDDLGSTKLVDQCKEDFNICSEFLGIESHNLLKILTKRTLIDPLSKNQIDKSMTLDQCKNCRDVIGKTLYSKMFDWIVKKINKSLSSNSEMGKNAKLNNILLIDIFGFEIFEENSFDQMCINYFNERLQQFFNNHIFKNEQDEYFKEKILFDRVSFKDNKEIIDLIDNPLKSIISI